jgi:hypothetical protein
MHIVKWVEACVSLALATTSTLKAISTVVQLLPHNLTSIDTGNKHTIPHSKHRQVCKHAIANLIFTH